MCGICGIFNTRNATTPDAPALVERMATSIAHRGPTHSGTYTPARVARGPRRLSVIDLSRNGRGPMANEDGTVWITFNGEIYNFADLKARFRLADKHQFRSATD